MKTVIRQVSYDELTQEEKESGLSNNGSGKEYASYIIIEDVDGKRIYSDAMEPEDSRFFRDLDWIIDELNKLKEAKDERV